MVDIPFDPGIKDEFMTDAVMGSGKYILYPMIFFDEVWVNASTHTDLADYYWISNHGRLYSDASERILVPSIEKNGYCRICLQSQDGKAIRRSIHRIMMESFAWFEGCQYYDVNHKNGNKQVNELWNLEWATKAENIQHAFRMGLNHSGEDSSLAIYDNVTVLRIADMLMQDYKYEYIGMTVFGYYNHIIQHLISNIANKHCWKYLLADYNFPTYRTHKQKFSDQKLDEIYRYHLDHPELDQRQLAEMFTPGYNDLDTVQQGIYRSTIKGLITNKAFDHIYSKYI